MHFGIGERVRIERGPLKGVIGEITDVTLVKTEKIGPTSLLRFLKGFLEITRRGYREKRNSSQIEKERSEKEEEIIDESTSFLPRYRVRLEDTFYEGDLGKIDNNEK